LAKSIKAHVGRMSSYECLDWRPDTSILMERGILSILFQGHFLSVF